MIQGFPKKKDLMLSDCGDNSCLFAGKGKGGMRTNGGCSCINNFIDECSSAVMKMLDKEKIGGVLQLRYFKLMHPEITESDAKIVANVLAQAIVDYMKGGV